MMRRPEFRSRLADQLHGTGLPTLGLLTAVETLAEVIAEFDAVAFPRKAEVEPLADGHVAVDELWYLNAQA